ncbi:MAG: hypothetical protein F4Z00_04065 [Acidimicrobiaceae bacterium]|nr:hypothetical protein [Acidimicrobiaceae bacterium]
MPQPPPDPGSKAPVADTAPAPHRGVLQAGWDKFRDNVVPGVIVTFVAGLALISFSDIKSDIDGLEDSVNASFSELKGEIATDFAAVDARFARLEDNIDARSTAVDARFARLEDNIDARFTRLEENQREIAQTLSRLVALVEAHFEVPAIASG